MTDPRLSHERQETNKKRTAEPNLIQKVLEAERGMGNSCSRRKLATLYGELADGNINKINELICEAIKQQWQLVLIVDDYTSIHRKQRPKADQIRQSKSMCTIATKVFKKSRPFRNVSLLHIIAIN